MPNNTLPLIDLKQDTWVLPSTADLSDYTFRFDFLPNKWLNETIKKTTKESIVIGKIKISTLHRYNYSLQTFFAFLSETKIPFDTFEDLTYDVTESFVHYLLANVKMPSTRAVAFASLKHHVRHGQFLEWNHFPKSEVFDGTETRTLQTEDSLKSTLLDDTVMDSIDAALIQMKSILQPSLTHLNDVVLWSLITIIRHTGIRLTEALNLHKDCLRKDLMKKYLLEVVSSKNETERFIPVSKEVSVAINILIQATEEIREELQTDKLFYYYQRNNHKYVPLSQRIARIWLKGRFITRFSIKENSGELATFTYHQFRHQIGTDLLNNGLSPFEVMQYLGHDSMHSTRLYARVRNDSLTKEYKKIGFIGVIEPKIENIVDGNGQKLDTEKRLMAQLPDGVCGKPINKQVINCKKPNACLFCPKFITTPEFLDVHKDHLERIKSDKERYMVEDLMGSDYLLNETEKTLEEIVRRLEDL